MANERVNRSPLSAREGKVYLDGVLIADTCKFQVVFKPDVGQENSFPSQEPTVAGLVTILRSPLRNGKQPGDIAI